MSPLASILILRPELIDSVSLGSQLALHILKLGLQMSHYIHQTFMWVLGIQSSVLTLAGQTLYWKSHLLSPLTLLLGENEMVQTSGLQS